MKDIEPSVYYWDSSALIKRYFKEDFSEVVTELFRRERAIHCTSVIAHAEILASFHRIRRDGQLSNSELQAIRSSFFGDWERLSVFQYTPETQKKAARLIEEVSLKGADLIHLATAEDVASLLTPPVVVTFDQQLVNAAKDKGFQI